MDELLESILKRLKDLETSNRKLWELIEEKEKQNKMSENESLEIIELIERETE